MNCYLILSFFSVIWLNASQAAVISEKQTTIQGPSSQSKITGPDGSVITAEAPGGAIEHQETPGFLESAGRLLGPPPPAMDPVVPGEVAHKAIDTALFGTAGTLATAQGGARSMMGGFGTPNV